MKVSVIVPVYNQACFLRDCLRSISDQTYTDIEIIIVDDGSTDTSSEICDEVASHDERIRVFHRENHGVSAARNFGVEASSGEYAMFVDGDDLLHPRAIATLLSLLAVNGAVIAIGQMCADDRRLSDTGDTALRSNIQAIEDTLYQRDIDNSLCCKLIPTAVLRSVPQPVGQRYEDLSAFYKIYEKASGLIVSTTANLYFYRPNPNSFIHTFTPERLDVIKVTDEIEAHYKDNPRLLSAAHDRKFSAYYNMYVLAKRAGMEDEARRLWSVVREYRRSEIANPKVRLKNKIGALVSYLGQNTVMLVSRLIY